MAKYKGLIKLKGSIGGMSFYDMEGKSFVRQSGGVDKEKIMSDPAFKRTRENMSEFGGSAVIGKAYRNSFAEVINVMGETYITGRVTGIMNKIIKQGSGVRGERVFEIIPHKEFIEGFDFNRKSPLGAVFYAPYDTISFNANRDIVSWSIPEFETESFISAPEGSTHFRLLLATGVLSNFSYNSSSKVYEATNPEENVLRGIDFSGEIPLGGTSGGIINLTTDLGVGAALPASVGVMAAIGIIFYQDINSQLYELASSNAMRVDAVG